MACPFTSVVVFAVTCACSYSSYDSLTRNENPWGGNFRATVQFLQSRMRGKTLTNLLNPGRPAPYASRVFIGEYVSAALNSHARMHVNPPPLPPTLAVLRSLRKASICVCAKA